MQVKQPEFRACCSNISVETKGSTTSRIVLLHYKSWPCREPTERRTPSGLEKVDSVFTSLMLGAQTQSEWIDSVALLWRQINHRELWFIPFYFCVILIAVYYFSSVLVQPRQALCNFVSKKSLWLNCIIVMCSLCLSKKTQRGGMENELVT